MSSTATRSAAMHPLDHRLERLDRRFGEDAVSEVEDVAGPPRGAGEHVPHLALELESRREQGHRVEVALNGDGAPGAADSLPRHVERDAPIDADHVAAGARE